MASVRTIETLAIKRVCLAFVVGRSDSPVLLVKGGLLSLFMRYVCFSVTSSGLRNASDGRGHGHREFPHEFPILVA